MLVSDDPGPVLKWTTLRASLALSLELGRHDDEVWAVAVLPDGRVVSGGQDYRVLMWDPAAPGTGPAELGRHKEAVIAVAMTTGCGCGMYRAGAGRCHPPRRMRRHSGTAIAGY